MLKLKHEKVIYFNLSTCKYDKQLKQGKTENQLKYINFTNHLSSYTATTNFIRISDHHEFWPPPPRLSSHHYFLLPPPIISNFDHSQPLSGDYFFLPLRYMFITFLLNKFILHIQPP